MSRPERLALADSFAAEYLPLEEGVPEAGRIARLDWDSEIFGFGVADYELPSETSIPGDLLADRLAAWQRRNAVDLVSCRASAGSTAVAETLSAAGFRFLELQLRATLPALRSAHLRAARLSVRPPAPEDRSHLLDIAARAFSVGRYHADPYFPRALADRRYRVWIERALERQSEQTRVFVIGPKGQPAGFLHAVVAAGAADLRLAGVDPDGPGVVGPELFLGALGRLAAEGVDRVTARLSAANTPALNLYASLAFRFHEPEFVFHRGSPPIAAKGVPSA